VVIRSRAAPIGISVTGFAGANDATGPSCSGVTTRRLSACQASIRWPVVVSWIGAVVGLNGLDRSPPPVETVSAAFGTSL
jgi:hypothetical protein